MRKSFKGIILLILFSLLLLLIGCGEAASGGGNVIEEEETEDENIMYEELEVGDTAPNFSVELLSGETVKLSDFDGKVVFLNFWATWCGPCVMEFPAVQQLADTFPDDLVVIAVNCSEKKSKVKEFIDENGYDFNIGLDESGKIQTKYPTMGIPYSVVIAPDGIVTSIHLGANDDMFPEYEEAVKVALGAK